MNNELRRDRNDDPAPFYFREPKKRFKKLRYFLKMI